MQTLNRYGFTVGNLDDATLLNTRWSALSASQLATLQQRGVGIPYPSYPTTGTTAGTVLQALKQYPQFSSAISPAAPMGKSWYDSAQLQLTKRFSHGLQANVNYTFSKNLSWTSTPDVFNRTIGKDVNGANPPQILRISLNIRFRSRRFTSPSSATATYPGYRRLGCFGRLVLSDRGISRTSSGRFDQFDRSVARPGIRCGTVEEECGWKLHESLVGGLD